MADRLWQFWLWCCVDIFWKWARRESYRREINGNISAVKKNVRFKVESLSLRLVHRSAIKTLRALRYLNHFDGINAGITWYDILLLLLLHKEMCFCFEALDSGADIFQMIKPWHYNSRYRSQIHSTCKTSWKDCDVTDYKYSLECFGFTS